MNRRAFTLLELILAMAGAAVLLTAVYTVFSSGVQLRNRVTASTREVRVQAHAAAVLRNDLRNARISGGILAASLEGSASGQSGSYPGYLKFTTTTARDFVTSAYEIPAADVQRVEYYIVNNPAATDRKSGLLVRAVQPDLLTTVDQAGTEEPLLAGVESMEVSFYSGAGWEESWNYTETKTVPEAVRVRLVLPAPEGGDTVPAPIEIVVPFATKIAIAAAAATEVAE